MALFLHKWYEIIFLKKHLTGPKWKYKKIAAHIGCSKFTTINWIKKYHQNKDLTDKPKSGQLHCTTEKQDKQIVKMAMKKHNITAIEIQK